MKLKDFKILFILTFFTQLAFTQNVVKGFVFNSLNQKGLKNIRIFDKITGKTLTITKPNGEFTIKTNELELDIVFITKRFETKELKLNTRVKKTHNIALVYKREELNVIEIKSYNKEKFQVTTLKDVEETAIYAGKKTEVVSLENSMANLATNNARQIYSQVTGLNIFQNDDGGLQLNIGGRGLDPNRTTNFNTRQNNYDISADVLGYPESYYSPPSEALSKVEIIRGAAALQYGTQFGGLINFKLKKPIKDKPIELLTRNTIGSYGLFTNFTSLSGTKNKFSYYTYYNYKKGNGFRPNSNYKSNNIFGHFNYKLSPKTDISAEITYFNYLAHQAGGLNDKMFETNPYQSNRTRNWFSVNWLLLNTKLKHQFNENKTLTFNFYTLNASRDAVGYRVNRVDNPDLSTERELIKGTYRNFGAETRFLSNYNLGNKKAVFLIGNKFYKSNNTAEQGPGSDKSDADFNLYTTEYPNYTPQNSYRFPNTNVSFFSENIFYLKENLTITPGARFEYIKTESDGYYKLINIDERNGDVLLNKTIYNNETNERSFVLLGLGTSYKPKKHLEIYSNISQNYKSVTFSDMSITNPSFFIDPDIKDESGYTFDIGIRGNYKNYISYDLTTFSLFYNDKISQVLTETSQGVKLKRTNVGNGVTYGLESMIDLDLNKLFIKDNDYTIKYFTNIALLNSKYTKSEENNVEGNNIEFVPKVNFKTGLKLGYKNLKSNIQYTYLSDQFSDASNSIEGGLTGIEGIIPAYSILDFSLSYQYKRYKLETGVNNLMNNAYFTRRATGYPGPGIIPSSPRNYFLTLEIKI